MKISILLPYKENFSPEYPGAVSLFVYETTKISRFKNNITIYGNTIFKKKFNLKYENIQLKKNPFKSQTRNYDGVDLLLSERTYRLCPSRAFKEVDRIKVKGKEEQVTIYTPL